MPDSARATAGRVAGASAQVHGFTGPMILGVILSCRVPNEVLCEAVRIIGIPGYHPRDTSFDVKKWANICDLTFKKLPFVKLYCNIKDVYPQLSLDGILKYSFPLSNYLCI